MVDGVFVVEYQSVAHQLVFHPDHRALLLLLGFSLHFQLFHPSNGLNAHIHFQFWCPGSALILVLQHDSHNHLFHHERCNCQHHYATKHPPHAPRIYLSFLDELANEGNAFV